jgi:hypothetical protein
MGSLRVFWFPQPIFTAYTSPYHRRNIVSIPAAPTDNKLKIKTETRKETQKEKCLQIEIKNEKGERKETKEGRQIIKKRKKA